MSQNNPECTPMYWRVNTPNLLQELNNVSNNGLGILTTPIKIFGSLLCRVAERASQLNDPAMNALMASLALYEVADPYSPGYDEKICKELLDYRKNWAEERAAKAEVNLA